MWFVVHDIIKTIIILLETDKTFFSSCSVFHIRYKFWKFSFLRREDTHNVKPTSWTLRMSLHSIIKAYQQINLSCLFRLQNTCYLLQTLQWNTSCSNKLTSCMIVYKLGFLIISFSIFFFTLLSAKHPGVNFSLNYVSHKSWR